MDNVWCLEVYLFEYSSEFMGYNVGCWYKVWCQCYLYHYGEVEFNESYLQRN